jgi:hypothetical protein
MLKDARTSQSAADESTQKEAVRPSPEQEEPTIAPTKVLDFRHPEHPHHKRASSFEDAMDVALGDEGDPWDEEDEAA